MTKYSLLGIYDERGSLFHSLPLLRTPFASRLWIYIADLPLFVKLFELFFLHNIIVAILIKAMNHGIIEFDFAFKPFVTKFLQWTRNVEMSWSEMSNKTTKHEQVYNAAISHLPKFVPYFPKRPGQRSRIFGSLFHFAT